MSVSKLLSRIVVPREEKAHEKSMEALLHGSHLRNHVRPLIASRHVNVRPHPRSPIIGAPNFCSSGRGSQLQANTEVLLVKTQTARGHVAHMRSSEPASLGHLPAASPSAIGELLHLRRDACGRSFARKSRRASPRRRRPCNRH
jgi:hypothetical protein